MTSTETTTTAGGAGRVAERFTVMVLLAMTVALAYLRLELLPGRYKPEPLVFDYVNPMLDARPGERVMLFSPENPASQTCSVVRPEGVVLRPAKGPERLGQHGGLRRALPYLACSIRRGHRGGDTCAGADTDTVLYALNFFGMPADTKVRIDSILPRWMRWGERELLVYQVVFERYGTLGGTWTTYLANEAPVAGLVKWTSLLPHKTEVHYRPVPPASD